MKLIRTIILIVICLYAGAYLGREKLNKGAEIAITRVKSVCTWVKGTWNNEQEKENDLE